MLPAVLIKGIDAIPAVRPVGSARYDAARLLPQLDPGDVVSARIEAKLPDGSFKVLLSGQALSLVLPEYVEPGDTLTLTFVAREPIPAFALKDSATAPALLSAAGRLVAATMSPAGESTAPAATLRLAAPATTASATGAALGAALADAVSQSGLFYESHQAEWLAGKRDLAEILLEPQARLAAPHAADTPLSATTRLADQLIHPQALPLVQQQLTALDAGCIALRAEIWPGQWMHWEIGEQIPRAADAPEAASGWRTRLVLDLPHLGEVSATLALAGEGLRVTLEAARSDSADLLEGESVSLSAALSAAGMPPLAIAVKHA